MHKRTAEANAELAVHMVDAVALDREIRVFNVTDAMSEVLHDRIELTSEL